MHIAIDIPPWLPAAVLMCGLGIYFLALLVTQEGARSAPLEDTDEDPWVESGVDEFYERWWDNRHRIHRVPRAFEFVSRPLRRSTPQARWTWCSLAEHIHRTNARRPLKRVRANG